MVERPRLIHPNGECMELRRILGKGYLPRSLLEEYRPLAAMYLRPDAADGLHGVGHSARVGILGLTLDMILDKRGIAVDPLAVAGFSQTHDLMRFDDKEDSQHGKRAAELVQSTRGIVKPSLVSTVAYMNMWHVPDDRLAPHMTHALAIIKDADGLDRVREKGALNPAFLRFAESRDLLMVPAQLLFYLSVQYEKEFGLSSFEAVMAAGAEMGIIGNG